MHVSKVLYASPSTGEIFTSTFDALAQGIVPTTSLPPSHPFLTLWKEHLAELTSTLSGPYDTVIDAFVALAEGNPKWRQEKAMTESKIASRMNEMRDLLSQHPPDVVVVSDVAYAYSFHPRRPSFWHYICISEDYVQLWVDAGKRSDKPSARNRRSENLKKLALTALLKTAFDHEIGHWLFTLKFGHDSDAKNTSKPRNATWYPKEEAGNFVEVRSRGGLLEYSKGSKKALLRTGSEPTNVHILPLSYLRVYGNNHSIRGTSSQLWFTRPGGKYFKKKTDIFFPHGADKESPPSSVHKPLVGHRERANCVYLAVKEIMESWES